MRNLPRKARMLAVAVALSITSVFAAPATPALALNSVACDEAGYLRIHYWGWWDGEEVPWSKCYANAGEDDQIYISRAFKLWSGNNAGYVLIGNDSRKIEFGKNETKTLDSYVTFLKIY